MKGILIVLLIPAVLTVALVATGQSIIGSEHDFTGTFGNGQLCIPCHTPHNAYPDATAEIKQVLWNHEETDAVFTMYTTLAGNTGTMDGTSKLCLSCHDGVTAMDNYGGFTGGVEVMTGSASFGVDLTNDHPIGIEYPPSDASQTPLPGYHATPQGNVKLAMVNGVPRVECSSCHDPHNTSNDEMLRDTKNGSTLCLNCHDI